MTQDLDFELLNISNCQLTQNWKTQSMANN